MCTSLKYGNCMGRNYDYEISYKETVINLPKDYEGNQYSLIGIGTGQVKDYPLLYDAMNEEGLCCSALAFTGNAYYNQFQNGKYNLPPFDFVQEIVGNFKSVKLAKDYLEETNIIDKSYSIKFPNTSLHWMICDKKECIVVEPMKDGLKIYDNPYNILTNNPTFPNQVKNMKEKMKDIGKYKSPKMEYWSRGYETYGVPGDTTSMGRFVRGSSYLQAMTIPKDQVCSDRTSVFHLLSCLEQPYGVTPVGLKFEYTIYSALYDMIQHELLIRTYNNFNVKRFKLSDDEWRVTL